MIETQFNNNDNRSGGGELGRRSRGKTLLAAGAGLVVATLSSSPSSSSTTPQQHQPLTTVPDALKCESSEAKRDSRSRSVTKKVSIERKSVSGAEARTEARTSTQLKQTRKSRTLVPEADGAKAEKPQQLTQIMNSFMAAYKTAAPSDVDEKGIADWRIVDRKKVQAATKQLKDCSQTEEDQGRAAVAIVKDLIKTGAVVLATKEVTHLRRDLPIKENSLLAQRHEGNQYKRLHKQATQSLGCLGQLFMKMPVVGKKMELDESADAKLPTVLSEFNQMLQGNRPAPGWIAEVKSLPTASLIRDDSTALSVPGEVIVPGGRFVENYYWDTYWVLRGLCVSGNIGEARTVLNNFFAEIDTIGFIPNGTRTYYLDRSQPPVISECVRAVYEATNDKRLLKQALPRLLRDYAGFWMNPANGHTVILKKKSSLTEGGNLLSDIMVRNATVLNRYYSQSDQPRPESYTRDVDMTAGIMPKERSRILQHIRAAAESGWDFSIRWRADACLGEDHLDHSDTVHFQQIATADILPVDLNALLYRYEKNIAFFAKQLGSVDFAAKFDALADRRAAAMREFMWDEEKQIWRDYFVTKKTQSAVVSAAAIVPLWAGVPTTKDPKKQQPFHKIPREVVMGWGIVPTPVDSNQQWDGPNVWPPLLQWAISYLDGNDWTMKNDGSGAKARPEMNFDSYIQTAVTTGRPLAQVVADALQGAKTDPDTRKLSRMLGAVVAAGWAHNSGKFYGSGAKTYTEKLCCLVEGRPGAGGEYVCQTGFGWSNGTLLEIAARYGPEVEGLMKAFDENSSLVAIQ